VHNSLETLRQNETVKKAMKERGLEIHGAIYDIAHAELKEIV